MRLLARASAGSRSPGEARWLMGGELPFGKLAKILLGEPDKRRVIDPSPPEKTSNCAQPSRSSSAPRSATAVSWLHKTTIASAGAS